jgi:hypothetical protein
MGLPLRFIWLTMLEEWQAACQPAVAVGRKGPSSLFSMTYFDDTVIAMFAPCFKTPANVFQLRPLRNIETRLKHERFTPDS